MTRFISLLERSEQLYEHVVMSPAAWPEARLAEWADDLLVDGEGLDRTTMQLVRWILRSAGRLQRFWLDDDPGRPDDHGDWRTRVDIAGGARAWRPVLDLAMHGLDQSPSVDMFLIVKELFAVVTSERWMEGVDYESWLDRQSS